MSGERTIRQLDKDTRPKRVIDVRSRDSLQRPGAYAYLGTGDFDKPGTQGPAHNGAFDLDEDALPMGAALYAGCALGWLRGVFD